jgi:hypothetical protein
MNHNLFVDLHRWAERQDENFTTEAFAHLLRHILSNEATFGIRILNKLTGLAWPVEAAREIQIVTQVTVDEGRPDIEIGLDRIHLVFVEVKVEARLWPDQVARYRAALSRARGSRAPLILLTKYPIVFPDGTIEPAGR